MKKKPAAAVAFATENLLGQKVLTMSEGDQVGALVLFNMAFLDVGQHVGIIPSFYECWRTWRRLEEHERVIVMRRWCLEFAYTYQN